jgi:hypothetical protein
MCSELRYSALFLGVFLYFASAPLSFLSLTFTLVYYGTGTYHTWVFSSASSFCIRLLLFFNVFSLVLPTFILNLGSTGNVSSYFLSSL